MPVKLIQNEFKPGNIQGRDQVTFALPLPPVQDRLRFFIGKSCWRNLLRLGVELRILGKPEPGGQEGKYQESIEKSLKN